MKILFFGDVSTWNTRGFSVTNLSPLLVGEIRNADYVFFNLEGPIGLRGKEYRQELRSNRAVHLFLNGLLFIFRRRAPLVCSDESIIELFKLNKNAIVCLANNHVKDLGLQGFRDTTRLLSENKVVYIGAEENLGEANLPLEIQNMIFINVNYVSSEKYGIPVRLYNATHNDYGAAYMGLRELKKKIEKLKSSGKIVFLILHYGKMLAETPDKSGINFDELARLGAEVIIIHHPHVYLKTAYERNRIYVLGDFLFQAPSLDPDRLSAFLSVELSGGEMHTRLVPLPISS